MDDYIKEGGNSSQMLEEEEAWQMFPRKMEAIKHKEADQLRYHCIMMTLFHSFFLVLEIFLYNFIFWMVTCEALYIWLTFQSFIYVNKNFVYIYILFMFAASFKIFNVAAVGWGFINTIMYILQIFIYVYIGGWSTYRYQKKLEEAEEKALIQQDDEQYSAKRSLNKLVNDGASEKSNKSDTTQFEKDPKLEWSKIKKAIRDSMIDMKEKAQSDAAKNMRARVGGAVANSYSVIRERMRKKSEDPQNTDNSYKQQE